MRKEVGKGVETCGAAHRSRAPHPGHAAPAGQLPSHWRPLAAARCVLCAGLRGDEVDVMGSLAEGGWADVL